jgi:uncharacterized membrane protein
MQRYELTEVVWNLLLALFPIGLAHALAWLGRRRGKPARWAALGLGAVWLAFLPNTFYLLTEWRHVLGAWARAGGDAYPKGEASLQLMSDTLFYAIYSGLGALTGALAVRPVVRAMRRSDWPVWPWLPPFFFLMAVGVYLGLILRYNSWDLMYRPADVWAAVAELRFQSDLLLALLLFGGFLWLVYLVADIWIDGFSCRWRQSSALPPTA